MFIFSYFEPNLIEKFLWESFFFLFQILVTWLFLRNENFFLAAIFKRNMFLDVVFLFCFVLFCFLLIYGCLRWTQIWCKFRTEIPLGKYLKMVGSKWTVPLVHKRGWKKKLRHTRKGVLHLLPKISMFCAPSQNNQHLFLKNNICII